MSNLRLISHGIDGICIALRQGLYELWRREEAGILYLQRVRCRLRNLPAGAFTGHHVVWSIGELTDHNGAAVPTSDASEQIATLGDTAVVVAPDGTPTKSEVGRVDNRDLAAFTGEGRYVEMNLAELPIRIVSLCLPENVTPEHHVRKPGEVGTPKYGQKMKFLSGLACHLTQARRSAAQAGHEYVITGDLSIANTRYDFRS